ncbi:polysaccharide deacetylase family protein [Glycomyces xiaoerkulensis]|uniref:polysaccharide deacetylase family protein n=1 Tax=Glycomyces xiaoerkulensis TaxID=2038139 RepID=UPI000C259E22|nr:polysaccharide deacetylase family protein [Glycomyces xiaoerkulensis]
MHGNRRRRSAIAVFTAVIATLGAALAFTFSSSPSHAQNCNGYVGLTFDDGPNPSTTASLLNALQSSGLRATVFNTGQNVASNPGLAQSQLDAGMWIANHSWSHPDMTQLSRQEMAQEIADTQQAIEQATGVTPDLFRPPYGSTNATLRDVESQYGLTEVLWDVDSEDWNGASTQQIVQAARQLQAGDVILMHDNYQSTIDAIPQIASDLQSRGLCSGRISPATGRAVAPDDDPGQPTTQAPTDTQSPTEPPPTTEPPGGDCSAVIEVVNDWGSGWQANVSVTGPTDGWTLSWNWPGSQGISSSWNAQISESGSSVTASDVGWNGGIASGQTQQVFGFIGSGPATEPTVTCNSN